MAATKEEILEARRQSGVDGELWISADDHMGEPIGLFEERLPANLRDKALRFPKDEYFKTGHHLRQGAWDPNERLKDMAIEGTAACVIYPTNGAQTFMIEDPVLEAAHARVYNNFMAKEYTSANPKRLWWLAVIPMGDMDLAVKEMEQAKKDGCCGFLTHIGPPVDRPWTSGHYAPFWAKAAELDTSVSIHTGSGPMTGGRALKVRNTPDTPWDQAARYDVMHNVGDIISSGVFEKYPNLNLILAEFGAGWMPFYFQELDYYYTARRAQIENPLPRPPSEYAWERKQIHAVFISDQVAGKWLPNYGLDNFMWSSDYPHEACNWPFGAEYIAQDLGHLTKEQRAKVICTNAARLYNGGQLPAPADPPGDMQSLETWEKLQFNATKVRPMKAFKTAVAQEFGRDGQSNNRD
jgi:predicted TIM-barrel fold metal-dependent hydrolase